MKKEFKPGDRVRVYGHQSNGWKPFAGVIVPSKKREWGEDDWLSVKGDDDTLRGAHPKQCRLLKPKPKPEKKDPRRVWMHPEGRRDIDLFAGGSVYVTNNAKPDNPEWKCFVELLPGHVLVDREMLAKAWDKLMDGTDLSLSAESSVFPILCKALGLEAK